MFHAAQATTKTTSGIDTLYFMTILPGHDAALCHTWLVAAFRGNYDMRKVLYQTKRKSILVG